MNEELTKSLTDLIDETLLELEELKKSRFSASEIDIKGPGEGIAGKPSNGKLDAAKAEDEKDEEDKDEKKDEAEKSDDPADSSEVKRKLKELGKAEDKKDDEEEDKEEDKDEKKKDAKDEKPAFDIKKSEEEMSSLMKSFVDERVRPLEDKLSTILDLVNKIADQPVASRGVSARTAILAKSADEGAAEPLTKAQVASKLFELKKSGTAVDSLDVTKAEMGQDLESITKKYKIS